MLFHAEDFPGLTQVPFPGVELLLKAVDIRTLQLISELTK
jgi:hypothetical protein